MNEIRLTKAQCGKIKKALKMLEEVRMSVELENIDKINEGGINWYVECSGSLHLMNGETHSGHYCTAEHENVIENFIFHEASGGGW